MQTSRVSDLLAMAPGTQVGQVKALVKQVWDPKRGDDWSYQDVIISDGGRNEFRCKFKNRNEFSKKFKQHWVSMTASQGQGKTGGLYGLRIDEHTFNGKTERILTVTPKAVIVAIQGTVPQPPPRQQQGQRQPQQQGQRPPARQQQAPQAPPAPNVSQVTGWLRQMTRLGYLAWEHTNYWAQFCESKGIPVSDLEKNNFFGALVIGGRNEGIHLGLPSALLAPLEPQAGSDGTLPPEEPPYDESGGAQPQEQGSMEEPPQDDGGQPPIDEPPASGPSGGDEAPPEEYPDPASAEGDLPL